MPAHDRIPPNNLEAEMAALGACLVDADLIDAVAEHANPADFYAHVHETIFAALVDLRSKRLPTDKIALAETLRRRGQLEDVGGVSYLTSLMDTVQTAASAEYYAKIVAEKAGLREIIRIGQEAMNRGYQDEDLGPVPVINHIGEKLDAVLLRRTPSRLLTGTDLAAEIEADWLAPRARRLHTPWGPINAATKGFGIRELTIWAGHPAQGKSNAVANLADFIARIYGDRLGPVGFWPLEMGRVKSNYRFCSMYTGIPAVRIEEKDLSDGEMARVRGAIRMLGELPIVMGDQQPPLDMATLRLQVRKIKRDRGLCAVIVDHVGWFREVREAEAKGGASAVHSAQTGIFQGLAELAMEFDVAVHAVMHLKRPSQMPADGNFPKPTMLDLRGGGNAEGHAHNIVLVWRPDPVLQPKVGAFIVVKARSGGEGEYWLEPLLAESVWLDPKDTQGDGGRWFPQAEAVWPLQGETPPPAAEALQEDEGYYETDEFPTEAPDWLDEDG